MWLSTYAVQHNLNQSLPQKQSVHYDSERRLVIHYDSERRLVIHYYSERRLVIHYLSIN